MPNQGRFAIPRKGQLFGIKIPLPLLIGVSGSAHRKLTLAWNSEPPLVWHLITAAMRGKGNASNNQDVFFARGGMRLLKASTAPSNLWRCFQKSLQRSPSSFRRARIVLMLRFAGCRLGRSSAGNSGAETGA